MKYVFSKWEDDNGLNRQLGKPRTVYDPFFVWGGGGGAGVVYKGNNSERCLKWDGEGH